MATSSRGLRVYRVRCVLLYVHNRPLPRVYAYTRVGDFDTPTHQPTNMLTLPSSIYIHMYTLMGRSPSQKCGVHMYMYNNCHTSACTGSRPHHHTPGLLRTNGDMETHMVAMGIAGDQREAPLVQAEVVVQVSRSCVQCTMYINHVHSTLRSIEKEIEKKQNKERNTITLHRHTSTGNSLNSLENRSRSHLA